MATAKRYTIRFTPIDEMVYVSPRDYTRRRAITFAQGCSWNTRYTLTEAISVEPEGTEPEVVARFSAGAEVRPVPTESEVMEYRVTVTYATGRTLVYHEGTAEGAVKVAAQTIALFEHTTFSVLIEHVAK